MFRVKQFAGTLFNTAFFAALLLGPAGTVWWPRAWVLLGVICASTAISIFWIREDLLDERVKPLVQRGQPLADKVVLIVFMASFIGVMVLIPFDVFRWHLMPGPGPAVSAAGLLLFAAGWWIATAAMVVNAFAAPVVKLQEERRHHVIDTGPYRVVRHPMYASLIPLVLGMALWLGSYAAAIAAAVPISLIAIRIVIEERFLRRRLPGYEAYTHRTRFRLIPFVW